MNTFKNNLKATLYYDMTAADTVIWLNQLVTSSEASTRLAAWPTCDATHTFTLTLASTVDSNVLEVVECTGVTANTTDYISFTCTRAKEGTTAIAHGKTTTTVENRLTAAALTAIIDAIASVTTTATTTNTRIDTLDATVSALSSTILGSIQSILATDSYIPNGCVPANGAEYTRAQFPSLYDDYLVGGKLLTCTYTEQTAQVALTGNCAKFALDTVNQKFKVPLLKDGDSITQASSAAELGKSVKAGLPNITGDASRGEVSGDVGFFIANTSLGSSGAFKRSTRSCSWAPAAGTGPAYALAIDASLSSPIYGNSTTVTPEQVRLRHFVVVANAQNSASVFDWSAYMSALAGKANTDLSTVTGNAINYYLHVCDEKPSGTNGGSATGGAWQTRDLNTIKVNRINATLANNRITLPAGRYYIRAKVPALAVNTVKASLYNYTTATYVMYGPPYFLQYGYNGFALMEVEGEFTLDGTAELELRMYSSTSVANTGLGYPVGISGVVEKYSEAMIWKM